MERGSERERGRESRSTVTRRSSKEGITDRSTASGGSAVGTFSECESESESGAADGAGNLPNHLPLGGLPGRDALMMQR